jgi:hypothetical protein
MVFRKIQLLNLKHRLNSSLEKSSIEKIMQSFKERTESFDDYYVYVKNEYNPFQFQNCTHFFYLCTMILKVPIVNSKSGYRKKYILTKPVYRII